MCELERSSEATGGDLDGRCAEESVVGVDGGVVSMV